MRLLYYYVCGVTFFCLGLTACFRDYKIDDSDNNQTFSLRLNPSYGKTELSWDITNVSSFKRYLIVRTTLPLSLDFVPNSSNIFKEIFSINENTFQDSSIITSPSVFYKVFVDVGGRFIGSNPVEVKSDAFVMPGRQNLYSFDKDSMRLLLGQANSNNLAVLYGLRRKTEINTSAQLNSFLSTNLPPAVFVAKPVSRFIFLSNARIVSLTVPGLGEIIDNIQSGTIFHSAAYNNPFLVITYVTNTSSVRSGQSIYQLTSNGLSLMSQNDRSVPGDKRIVEFTANGRVVELAVGYAHTYTISFDGKPVNFTNKLLPDIKSLTSKISLSPDKSQFIASTDGTIYDQFLTPVWKRNCLDCQSFAFSEDGEYLYEVSKRNIFTNETFIRKYDLKTQKKMAERPVQGSSIAVLDIHPFDGQLGIIYAVNTNTIHYQNIEL
jgi:hypothetical protein